MAHSSLESPLSSQNLSASFHMAQDFLTKARQDQKDTDVIAAISELDSEDTELAGVEPLAKTIEGIANRFRVELKNAVITLSTNLDQDSSPNQELALLQLKIPFATLEDDLAPSDRVSTDVCKCVTISSVEINAKSRVQQGLESNLGTLDELVVKLRLNGTGEIQHLNIAMDLKLARFRVSPSHINYLKKVSETLKRLRRNVKGTVYSKYISTFQLKPLFRRTRLLSSNRL